MDKLSATLPSALEQFQTRETKAAGESGSLGQEQFFELMVTQLKNQDPFKPMESGEFLGQIAQFSTVSGIGELQKSFATLASSLQSNQALQASTMVGREVVVPRDDFVRRSDMPAQLSAELPAEASRVLVSIADANGQIVRRAQLGGHDAGRVEFAWDGRTDAGKTAPVGLYRMRFDATIDGLDQALDSAVRVRVDSVSLSRTGAAPTLNLAGHGTVTMSDVRQIL